jgi:hypothetical protein
MNRQVAPLISCLALMTVAACSSDISAPAAVERTARIGPRNLDLTASNAYVCSITQFDEDGAAVRVEKRIRPRSRPSLEQVASDTAFMASWHVRYDRPSKRKLVEAHCVLPANQEARQYATRYFESIDPKTLEGHGTVPMNGDVGLWSGTIWCSYYSYYDELDCYGTSCYSSMYVPTRGPQARPGESFMLAGSYWCDNGCVIDGYNLTYDCGGGGGGPFEPGDEGGGGGGGDPYAYPPEGVDQNAYNRMNAQEKALCHASPGECTGVYIAKNEAEDFAHQARLADGADGDEHNNKYDAMRHAYWNAVMARAMGADRAKAWADAHESTSQPDDPERCMDLFNNDKGRTVGVEMAAQPAPYMQLRIRDMANTGQLQNSPGC